MRLMYTLLLQYDKSKYVDFAGVCFFLFSSLFCALPVVQTETGEKERENIRAQQQEESAIVLHIRMQSKLVSRSNKRQELNSLPMLAAIVRNMCIRRVFFSCVPVAGEDECQKQISK